MVKILSYNFSLTKQHILLKFLRLYLHHTGDCNLRPGLVPLAWPGPSNPFSLIKILYMQSSDFQVRSKVEMKYNYKAVQKILAKRVCIGPTFCSACYPWAHGSRAVDPDPGFFFFRFKLIGMV